MRNIHNGILHVPHAIQVIDVSSPFTEYISLRRKKLIIVSVCFLFQRRSIILLLLLMFHRRSIIMKPAFQPLSFLDLFAFQVLLFFPLCLRPFHGRALVFFPPLCAVYYRLITASLGDTPLDWSLALALTPQLIKALDIWVLTDAEGELRRVNALREDPATFDIWKKTAWAFELVSTPRGVGWNWEVPYVCYAGTTSRR